MQTQEVVIKPTLKVVLKSDSQNLDEVVVTAMGIKRSEKSLGYAVSSVKGDEITKARESNVLNSLSGKIAGLQIAQSSGTVGGSSSIQIRGASSIGTVSSPLFIIDGLPIDNGSYNPDRTNGIVDVGNRAGDINSDDIESINVLKGAAATALYGARAKDGAIVITTKKGKKNSPVFVTVNSSTRFENVLKLPDFQNEYAQGSYGVYNVKMLNGWGPKISSVQDQQFTDYKGDKVTLKANPDNVKDFYETGMSYINNVSVAGGGEKADFRLSFTSTNQTGVVPGSDYNKYAFSVNAGMNFTNNFTGRISAQYIRSDSEGRPAQGANDSNLLIPLINGLPRTIDIHDIKQNWIDENGKQITLDPEGKSNNPYWIINKNKFTNNLDRMIGNITLTYKPIEGLTITNDAGTDFYTEGRRKVYAKGTVGALNGKFQTWNLYKRIINNDLMVSYEKTFANDYHFKAMVGHNLYQEEWKNENVQAQNLVVDELYTYTNAKSTTPVNYYEKKRLVGLYGEISLGYKAMLIVNVTGRNDWFSTLDPDNNHYFYPSIGMSWVFSDTFKTPDWFTFGKIRASYAAASNGTKAYQNLLTYKVDNYQSNGQPVVTINNSTVPNKGLKPVQISEWEIGLNLSFLDNRLSLDAAYYKKTTKDDIVQVTTSGASGFESAIQNVGEIRNSGVEVMVNAVPIHTKDFNWNSTFNIAYNSSDVKYLGKDGTRENIKRLTLDGATSRLGNVSVQNILGHPYGELVGYEYKRTPDGQVIFENGLPVHSDEVQVLGNGVYKVTGGWRNEFTYKNITLAFLIDFKAGAKLFSGTNLSLYSNGLHKNTLQGRGADGKGTMVGDGVMSDGKGGYVKNTVAVSAQDYWQAITNQNIAEEFVYNASFIKLRELSIGYTLPQAWLNKQTLIKGVTLSLVGRNLWTILKHTDNIDPESAYNNGNAQGLELNGYPATRNVGFNVNVKF